MSGRSPARVEGGPLRQLPNLISGLRMVLVAPLIAMIVLDRYEIALALAVVAGISDGVDGFLARRFGWQSRLGSILDPIADKMMLVGCLVALGWLREVPGWLVVVVVVRDVVIVSGALAWHRILGGFEAHPSWLSKTTTVAQTGFVLLVLAGHAFEWPLRMVIPVWVVAVLTAASGVDYGTRWSRSAWLELKHGKHRS